MIGPSLALLSVAVVLLGALSVYRSSSEVFSSNGLQQLLSGPSVGEAVGATTAAAAGLGFTLGTSCGQAATIAYGWLAANPYPAVIGGMLVYMLVLMTASSYLDKGRTGQHADFKRRYQEHQRFQHYMRLKRWQEQNPQQNQQQQQEQRQQQSTSKWAGMMGFGVQSMPDGCRGPVQEVLSAMDYYEVLEVSWNNITHRALKTARKAKALSVHPDKVGRDTPGCDLAGSRVNMAYETLADAKLRLEYDDWLSRQS